MQTILRKRIHWFIAVEATYVQKQDIYTRNKFKAETRMTNICGSRHVVLDIWAVGLPDVRLPSLFVREQQVRYGIQRVVEHILNWLNMFVEAIQNHKQKDSFQETKRKCGTPNGNHGFIVTELQARTAKINLRHAKYLARQWEHIRLIFESRTHYEWELLCQ